MPIETIDSHEETAITTSSSEITTSFTTPTKTDTTISEEIITQNEVNTATDLEIDPENDDFQFKSLQKYKSFRENQIKKTQEPRFPTLSRSNSSFREKWVAESQSPTFLSLNRFNSSFRERFTATDGPMQDYNFPPMPSLSRANSSFRYRANSDPSIQINIDDEYSIIRRRDDRTRSLSGDFITADGEETSIDAPNSLLSPTKPNKLNVNLGANMSDVLSNQHINCLVTHLPAILKYCTWNILYSVLLHGADFNTFYSRTAGCKYTLLVVKSMDGQVFGGFAAEPWKLQKSHMFYGTGESFLFRACKFTCILSMPTYTYTYITDFYFMCSE